MTEQERFESKVAKTDGCWLWTAKRNRTGYGQFACNRNGGTQRLVSAHRWAWMRVNGPIPEGLCVCHKCDVPLCVRPDHLFLGTVQDNIADMDAKGRRNAPRFLGEAHPKARLTESDIRSIRQRRADGERQDVLAREYGVAGPHISGIVHRKYWRHVA